jgi:hypothetical protein
MQVKMDVVITDDDGSAFYSANNVWDGVSRQDVVMLEKMLVKFLADLTEVGAAKAKDKK